MVHRPSRATPPEQDLLARLYAALKADPRAGGAETLTLALADDVLTIDGEVATVAAKTRALHDAAAFPEIRWVIDHIRVAPAAHMEDAEIRDHVRNALLQDSAFDDCRIVVRRRGTDGIVHDPLGARGSVTIEVTNGVVTLDGDVPSLVHRRLVGVLAWWVPGTCAVANRLGVAPPERDTDDEITDAVRIVLEKDRLVDAAQLTVRTRAGHVTLTGTMKNRAQADVCVRDAWYVQGVEGVTDAIQALT